MIILSLMGQFVFVLCICICIYLFVHFFKQSFFFSKIKADAKEKKNIYILIQWVWLCWSRRTNGFFRPNRSTYMAINGFYCKITDELDNKHHCLWIFLALSKAFDTLNHDIFLKLNVDSIGDIANA